MAGGGAMPRVFLEPRIEPHDPALYSFDGLGQGVRGLDGVTDAAILAYRESGFLLVAGLFDAAAISAARDELRAMTLSDAPACAMIHYESRLRDHLPVDAGADRTVDGRRTGVGFALGQESTILPPIEPELRASLVRKFLGFVEHHPPLAALAYDPGLLGVVRRLIGAAPLLFQDMALIKPPFGREKPWHQDHAYFNLPIATPIAGVWLPLEPATPENGCMHLIPGGHLQGPRPHFKRRDWQICDRDIAPGGRIAVPMQPGDALFFDGKLPHGTPTNRTPQHRWAVQFHYRPAEARMVDDAVRLAAFGSEGKDVTC
jgi:phytanoyl-CoA hydroxylase